MYEDILSSHNSPTSSLIAHLRRRLITHQLRSTSQLNLLLVLYNCTAATPKRRAAVGAAATADPVPVSHLAPSDCLDDPLAAHHAEEGEESALHDISSVRELYCT